MNATQKALLKAADARLMEPDVAEAVPLLRVTRLRVPLAELQEDDRPEPRDRHDTDPRLMVERRTPATALVISGRRDDWRDLPDGALLAFTAWWVDAESPTVLVRRRGQAVRPSGYRALLAELKSGTEAEDAADRVQAHLGALFFDRHPATRPTGNPFIL